MDSASARRARRNIACDECKRRKIRCSAEPVCASCQRDRKNCIYSTPSHRIAALERTIQQYESLFETITKAWPGDVPLEEALRRETNAAAGAQSPAGRQPRSVTSAPSRITTSSTDAGSASDLGTPEQDNAEDYEFDESQDLNNAIDGMGFLTSEASKAGYTGPQSGIAALKLLRSLPSAPRGEYGPDSFLPNVAAGQSLSASQAVNVDGYINDYFTYYHPAYPLLIEGVFRARIFGAVAKPRDGSWPLLYNMVVAMGAFAGSAGDHDIDWQYYLAARTSISLDVIGKGSLCYVQGLTIMANYLQKRNKPNAGFALIGVAWSMAMGIGLHREFGAFSTTHYTMEQRRRTWWTLYCFVSGAQLTLGRPPASLIGINLRLPANLDDTSLNVEMTELPGPEEGPTVATCLIAQAKFAQVANEVQAELLTNQVPSTQTADKLRKAINTWRQELPTCFEEQMHFDTWFELPKRVLLWRAYHLRIVLDRPFLFRAISERTDLSSCEGPARECIDIAEECIVAICDFLDKSPDLRRGFAWYATYWLVSAAFVHAVCFAYTSPGTSKDHWRRRIQEAVQGLSKLSIAHTKAMQASQVLTRLLATPEQSVPSGGMGAGWAGPLSADTSLLDFSMNYFGVRDPGQLDAFAFDSPTFDSAGGPPLWDQPHEPNAELSDAAGGITLQNFPDGWN